MDSRWGWTMFVLCAFGFMKEMRPSEHYLTQYLRGPYHNLSKTEINNEIYPIWTYSYMVLLFGVLLLTDLTRYKPMIVLEAFGYVVTWVLLVWGRGVFAMQVMQATYGIATSCEVAYFTYIYSKVSKDYYPKATSFTRAATLAGKCLSGFLAQALVSFSLADDRDLHVISLVAVSICLVLAIMLPSVEGSIYFYRDPVVHELGTEPSSSAVRRRRASFRYVMSVMASDFKAAYSKGFIVKWSIWWALAMSGYLQAGNYIQPLWEEIKPGSKGGNYNGAVDSIKTLLSALAAFSLGFTDVDWNKYGECLLAVASALEAGLLFVMSQTHDIWTAYSTYIVFRIIYQVLITVASFQVAKDLKDDSYGLIFGCNTFFALIVQTITTIVVVDKRGLMLGPRSQFLVYGGQFCFMSVLFFAISIYAARKSCRKSRHIDFRENNDCAAVRRENEQTDDERDLRL